MQDDGAYTAIEFPMAGETYQEERYGVYRYSTYPESSVLAGKERRSFLDSFETEAEAKKAYPDAEGTGGCGYRAPYIPDTPPAWFDPANAGESWDGE